MPLGSWDNAYCIRVRQPGTVNETQVWLRAGTSFRKPELLRSSDSVQGTVHLKYKLNKYY